VWLLSRLRSSDPVTRTHIVGGLAVVFLLATPGASFAQADSARSDTLPSVRYRLDDITVVAYGTSIVLRESAAATTILTRDAIDRLPARTLPDVLAFVPGLIFLERDGSGQLPMAVARGFFGGGETAYVRLNIDGVPVNDMRTGVVEWPQIPLSSVERIEVMRGSASTMYGDAAMGAVVNVVTQRSDSSPIRGRTGIGAWDERFGQVAGDWGLGAGSIGVSSTWSRLEGFRDHSSSEDVSLASSYQNSATAPWQFSGRVFARRSIRDEPGPLTVDEAGLNPRQSGFLFATDHRVLDMLDLAAGVARRVSEASLNRTAVTAGTEVEYGGFSTEYRAPDGAMDILSDGKGDRLKLGVYAEGHQRLTDRWNAFAGMRLDVLDAGRDDVEGADANYAEFSPRVGINYAHSQQQNKSGHVYASVSRSFKAPTLDQLYDVREFPSGNGPLSIANPELQPQTSTSLEIGIFQRLPLWANAFAELDVALYRITVDDEIDFDLSTFRYGNIQESVHEGLEMSVTANLTRWMSVQHSMTLMRVLFRSGEFEGNWLKNIPRRSLATAVRLMPLQGFRFTLTHRHTGSLNLDDGNAHEIPGYHRFGARAEWVLGPAASVFVSANNLFDATASSLGFLSFDPTTGRQVPFVYPLGGRALRLGVSVPAL